MAADLDTLYEQADERNVHILCYNFSATKKGACAKSGDYEAVILDYRTIKTQREEKEVLAEELAHLETGAMYVLEGANSYQYRQNVAKAEYRANRHKCERLVSVEDVLSIWADQSITSDYEAAEELDVSVETWLGAVKSYRQKELLPY